MKQTAYALLYLSGLILSSCTSSMTTDKDPSLISIQVIDRNGFSETISTKDRLARYQKTDFFEPQPYQKVLRVYSKDLEGKTPSVLTSYHTNGYLHQYLEAMNGRARGIYREWHSNGSEKMKLHVIEGIPELSESAMKSWVFDGPATIYDENEALIAEIHYELGVLQGNSLYYYPSGSVQKCLPYHQDKLDGGLVCYSEEGEIEEVIPHKRGLRHGTASSFFSSKNLSYKEEFEEGLLQSGTYFSETGEVISTIHEGVGRRVEREKGLIKRIVDYNQGLPEGFVECYNPKGDLQVVFQQKDGKKQGEELEYYPKKIGSSLQPKILLTWQEDTLQGLVKTWFTSGKQESQKEMYQNQKNGPSYAWYANGDLMLYEEYEKDELLMGTYYKKGDKQPVSRVVSGKGTATLYHPDGYLMQKVSYDKGVPCTNYESTK